MSTARVTRVALVGVLAATLSGCATAPAPPPGPAPLPAHGRPLVQKAAAVPAAPEVPGLTPTGLRQDAVGFTATPTYLTGAEPLNDAVDAVIRDTLVAAGGAPWVDLAEPDDAATGWAVTTEVASAAGPMVALRVLVTRDGAPVRTEVLHYDVVAGAMAAPLLQPSAPIEARTLVFDATGAAVATAAEGEPGVPRRIEADAVRTMLTDAGRAAQDAVIAGAPLMPLPASAPHVPCSLVPCIALTYDDGPSARDTGRLLDTLRDAGVRATFFVLGGAANARPELIARQLAEGHAIGNHSWDHADLAGLEPAAIQEELTWTDDAVQRAGAGRPSTIRAPYGSTGGAVTSTVDRPLISWTVDPDDWRDPDPASIADRVLSRVAPGGIVLMHDIYPATVDAAPAIIAGLRERGLIPVTVPQLLGGYRPAPGEIVTCRGAGERCFGP